MRMSKRGSVLLYMTERAPPDQISHLASANCHLNGERLPSRRKLAVRFRIATIPNLHRVNKTKDRSLILNLVFCLLF